jgi:soluble lytic murein transglycosylase-like protein
MKNGLMLLVVAGVALGAAADDRFSASAIPGAHLKGSGNGKVVISNTRGSISAYRFFGNVREALVTLKTAAGLSNLTFHPFGSVLFDSSARNSIALPPYLAALVNEAAQKHGVDPRLIAAVASRESAFNPNAVSPVGARGVMQLMPATAQFLGVTNISDPRENIYGGTRYLRQLLDAFHGDLDLTLAAYNAGPGAVQRYGGVPPFRETQAYVAAVRSRYERALRNQ